MEQRTHFVGEIYKLLVVIYNLFVLFNHQSISTQDYKCNHGHIIVRLFDTLPNFLFTTSETKRD